MSKKRKRSTFVEFSKIKKIKSNEKEEKKECKYKYCNNMEKISGYCKIHFLQALENDLINLNKLKLSELVLIKEYNIKNELKNEIDSIIMLKSFELLKIKN
jgi:hypothetical protein